VALAQWFKNATNKLVPASTLEPLPVDIVSSGGVPATPETFTAPTSGELAGSVVALQMPSIPCSLVIFKAAHDNAGKGYIGAAGVTKADGTTDVTTGFVLAAGEDTGWIPVDNLSRLFRICDAATDDLVYLALA